MNGKSLAFIPIPALIVLIGTLYISVNPSLFYEPGWLIPVTNTLFVTVVGLAVAYIAMRNYKANGRVQILLLGCGVLAFGLGGLVAGFARRIPESGANLNVAIYNTAALAASAYHFIAAFLLASGASTETAPNRRDFWLISGYAGTTGLIALFSLACMQGLIPPFFVQGVGPTPLRQAILGSADVLFAFSFLVFLATYLRNREVFLYWYSLALALTSISLTAFFLQSSVGSTVGWAGRFAQYLGGIYFLVALNSAVQAAQTRKTSFDNIITASLSAAEERFRALAENSPDIIERFDRELRHTYINPAGLGVYGRPAGDIIGKPLAETGVAEPYRTLLQERIRKVFESGQPLEIEDDIPVWDGVRFYRSSYVPEFGVDGTVHNVLVVSTDLSERRKAEEELRESRAELKKSNVELEQRVLDRTAALGRANEMLHAEAAGRLKAQDAVAAERQRLFDVLETVPAMVCLLTPDYHVAFANRSFRDKFGEADGRRCYEYCFGRSEPCEFCESYKVLETGEPHHWEVAGPDGSVIDAYDFPFTDVDGSPLVLEMDIDITEQRRAETAMKQMNETLEQRVAERTFELTATNERYQLLASIAGVLLRTMQPQKAVEGVCREVMVHLDCHVFFNFLADEKTGKLRLNAWAGIPAEEARRIEWLEYGVAVCGCVGRDGKRIVAEHIPTTPDERTELVKSYGVKAYVCHPLLGPGGKVIGTLSFGTRTRETFRDDDLSLMKAVTDHVAIAMTRLRNEEALRSSLADKDVLMRELAHRTKNNMQVIGSLLGLQAAASNDERLLDALADTQDRIRAMALVHENLYRSGNIASLDMKDYVEDLMSSLLRVHQGTGGTIRSNLDVDRLFLSIDVALPGGLIINELVSNSLKHAFPGGKSGNIFLSLRRDGEKVVLRYRDDGPGLPRDLDLSGINSLGLKLVYNLAVRQLRGTMEIRHDPVSEFVFTFDGFTHMRKM